MLAIDIESTGIDLRHGAKPFYVTTCTDKGGMQNWEWYVDPYCREPRVPPEDLKAIKDLIEEHRHDGGIIGHNIKFDVTALAQIGLTDWPWEQTHDTILAAHLLGSNLPKNLTYLALMYLNHDIQPLEDKLEVAVKKARDKARRYHKRFRIAHKELEEMPSRPNKDVWRADYWLPKVMAHELILEYDHEWWTVLADYANADSEVTIALWHVFEQELKRRDLWEIYLMRRKLPAITYRMERNAVTGSCSDVYFLRDEYQDESTRRDKICVNIAARMGHKISLPKAGNNQALIQFVYGEDGLNLPPIKRSDKTGVPSLDKGVIEEYLKDLPPTTMAGQFIRSLAYKRKRDTALSFIDAYERFWIVGEDGRFRIHPNYKITGSSTLRFSCENPNSQNISKKGMYEGDPYNLRYGFGPGDGFEWWSFDYQNLELKIPAYEAGEGVMIELFEKPDDPPYFGSYHLLNASIVYPDLFWPLADQKGAFKKKYGATYYQWIKNFGFAYQYSGGRETCDRAAHKRGAYDAVKASLKNMTALNDRYVRDSRRLGYVETLPDKTVNPRRGYPLLCSRNDFGGIVETTPLNYHVQGTAMWCTCKAMIRVQDKLDEWNRQEGAENYTMAIQVHDELVLQFPKSRNHPKNDVGKKFRTSNLWRARVIQRLMGQSGDDIGIPLTVGVEYHSANWAQGETL